LTPTDDAGRRGANGAPIHLDSVTVLLGRRTVLESLSLSVLEGEKVMILGRNGAGKTTLLKTILGLVKPVSGTAGVLGSPVGSRSWSSLRRYVGYVHQESVPTDFPISALEVVEIGAGGHRRERGGNVAAAMMKTGCHHLRNQLFGTLSGGEKQKVSLARCLCQKPRILLLDEPTASLDLDSKEELSKLLEDLNRDLAITILMVSHELYLFRRSGWRVVQLKSGKIAAPVESS
jgi:zinc transport system ATP-binding protein